MSDIEVKELAAMVKAPVDVLMRQLEKAGIHVSGPGDKISAAQKLMLLEHMNKQVEVSGNRPTSKKITLKKRNETGGGRKGGVEVRRKKTLSSVRNSDYHQPMKRDIEAEKRAEELAQKVESERLLREDLIQKAERERREIEAMRLRGEPAASIKEAEQQQSTEAEMAAAQQAATAAHTEVAKLADAQQTSVASEPAAEAVTTSQPTSEKAAAVPSTKGTGAPEEPPVDKTQKSVTGASDPTPVSSTKTAAPSNVEKPTKPDTPVVQNRNDNEPVVKPDTPETPAKTPDTEPRQAAIKDMSALEKRQVVADAARREAAAALKRRPSRAKAKPSLAPKNTIAADASAKAAPAEKVADPVEKALDNKKQDKKRVKTRGRENERGNVKQTGRRKGGRRHQEPVIDREIKHGFEKPTAPVVREIEIPATIVVSDLAQKLAIRATDIIKSMMKMGMMVTINQSIDQETAMLVVEELGHVATPMQEVDDESILAEVLGSSGEFEKKIRPPVVTIMGHVDHGKTSLLDYIRETRVASGEAGGITQHIGAYHVKAAQGSVTFLDTPGHAAFTKMRARGAQVTDIVVLIVAADDGVKPQTKEAIQHAKAAEVPMVVAINKMDKPEADPDKVLNELSQNDVLTEDWGGDIPVVRLSAKTGEGIDKLLETLLLVAEVEELTAAPEAPATGSVIEASIERGRGVVATVLVREGTLAKGDLLLCGKEYGRIRAMFDERGRSVKAAGASIPIAVLGLSGVPEAGDEAFVVSDERKAREIAQMRQEKQRDSRLAEQQSSKLDNLFNQMQSDAKVQLNVLVKADVQGSLEAIRSELTGLSTEEIEVRIISSGIGGLNEGDIDLATASGATVIAFNVRADATARRLAQEGEIEIRYYSIIYDVINDIRDAMSGMLSPETKEVFLGLAEVKDVFRASGFGQVAGCLVVEGSVRRGNPIRVLRDNVVIFEGELESLRRHRDDVKEVNMGTECGIAVKNYNDVRAGDQIEVFERIEVARKI